LKLCFLAPANSVHSIRWCKYFADRGHDVHLISFHPAVAPVPEGVRVYRIDIGSVPVIKYLKAYWRVKRLIREIAPDILHLHSLALYGLGAYAGQHPYVATAWGSDVIDYQHGCISGRHLRYVLRMARATTCDAHHMRDLMLRLGAVPNNVKMVMFGIDTERFIPVSRSRTIESKHGLHGRQVVISMRNFYPVYDIETLIEAVPMVIKGGVDPVFMIVGTGPEESRLRALTRKYCVEKHIVFTGALDNEVLPAYLSLADVYVSTALSDAGISASTAEAMACEKPVIVTDSGENSRWIDDGRNGYVIPVRSPRILADRIVMLLKEGETRRIMGGLARKRIIEKCNYQTEMAHMEEIYRECVIAEDLHGTEKAC